MKANSGKTRLREWKEKGMGNERMLLESTTLARASRRLAPSRRVGDVVGVRLTTVVGQCVRAFADRVESASVLTLSLRKDGSLGSILVVLVVQVGVNKDTAGHAVTDGETSLGIIRKTIGEVVGVVDDGSTYQLTLWKERRLGTEKVVAVSSVQTSLSA